MLKMILSSIFAILVMSLSSCFHEDDTGVCTGYSQSLGHTYCYSDFTQEECSSYNDQQVNGATWYWYEGQTCADRGLNEGSN